MERDEIPPVAAIFLVCFDQKVGYTIAWKRNLPDVELDGVEYKSLPSGLHAVKEDLVYFIHAEQYAGVSAFVQEEADVEHRNANFAAVGALVPLSYGQLGRSWVHADSLRRLAREVVKNISDTGALESFWEQHRSDERRAPATVPGSAERTRAVSDASLAGFNASGAWPIDHPALHVSGILDTFGPLLFPLHRAALARKRVLLLGSPSVQDHANIVYITSILASIPRNLGDSLPSEAEPLFRSSALFQVGLRDIDELASRDRSTGWLACTTDDILGEKKQLYDLLVELPAAKPLSPQKIWPKLRTSDGKELKASQRDLRRWTLLRRELRRLRQQTVGHYSDQTVADNADDSDERPLLERRTASTVFFDNTGLQDRDESEAVEASSWGALAYKGFLWWASAGEASAWENDEAKADEEILFDMPDVSGVFPGSGPMTEAHGDEFEYSRAVATMLVAYFRRVTESVLRTLASIVEDADDNTEEGLREDNIQITGDDVRAMGLDSWSEEDRIFVTDMMKTWFDRDVTMSEHGVKLCGVKIC